MDPRTTQLLDTLDQADRDLPKAFRAQFPQDRDLFERLVDHLIGASAATIPTGVDIEHGQIIAAMAHLGVRQLLCGWGLVERARTLESAPHIRAVAELAAYVARASRDRKLARLWIQARNRPGDYDKHFKTKKFDAVALQNRKILKDAFGWMSDHTHANFLAVVGQFASNPTSWQLFYTDTDLGLMRGFGFGILKVGFAFAEEVLLGQQRIRVRDSTPPDFLVLQSSYETLVGTARPWFNNAFRHTAAAARARNT